MKKTLLIAGLVVSTFAGLKSQAQVRVNINIGTPVAQQSWYANDNDYYYIPEQGVYYNTRRNVYVYPENGGWYTASRLPERYGNVTYRNARYVRIHDRSPFNRDNDYRQRYHTSNNPHDNGRHDNRYRGDNEHHHDNGNHYGEGRR